MKRSLVALSLAALAAAGCATPPPPAFQFDRILPAAPEHEFDGRREYAGVLTHDYTIRVQLG